MVTSWSGTGFTESGTQLGGYLAVGGAAIRVKAGSLTQPLTPGPQTVTTGIQARAVFFMSVGAPTSTSVRTDMLQWIFGQADGRHQGCYWGGEIGNNPSAPLGARYVTNTYVYVSGTPNGSGTNLNSAARVTAFDGVAGSFTLTWDVVSGAANQILWFAIGEDVGPPTPTPAGETRLVRCVRRFPLPFDEGARIFIDRLQIIAQTGVGLSTGQGSDPVAMIRLSRDGGHTWGDELWVPLGKIGEFKRQAKLNRLGYGRNLVCEIAVSDPVFVGLIQCVIDADRGVH